MRKYVLFGLFALGLFIVVSVLILRKDEQKDNIVKQNLFKVKKGMSVKDVEKLLNTPDTTYRYDSIGKYGSGVVAFQYYLGLGESDIVKILARRDTVIDIIF
jgi:hypothetical protein